jgi:type VI secretion system protein ImpA
MSLLEELLAPISDDEPAGPDLSLSNEYAEIERAYLDADVPPFLSPTGAVAEPDTMFSDVVGLAKDFLGNQSKDLKISALLAGGLLREEGFSGLASGLELLRDLLDQYWETLHPGPAGRVAVLNWLGSEDVAYALYLTPFTEGGHTYFHYKEWVKTEEGAEPAATGDKAQDADAATELSGASFGQGFVETSWVWYNELCSSLDRSAAALEALDSLGRERFPEADEKPPRYNDLAGALKRVTTAAHELLDRKPPPTPAGADTPDEAGGDAAVSTAGAGQAAVTTEPRNPAEAGAAIAAAARVLRHADPLNPAPYLVLRGFRWGELRASGDQPDPRELVAPSAKQRTYLRSLFLDQKWDELLEAVEDIMATPAGRGWLDLQRYAVLAAEGLGAEYNQVQAALRSALEGLIADIPDLVRATLMDDSDAASRDTVAWLASQQLLSHELFDRLAKLDPLLVVEASDYVPPPRPSAPAEPSAAEPEEAESEDAEPGGEELEVGAEEGGDG